MQTGHVPEFQGLGPVGTGGLGTRIRCRGHLETGHALRKVTLLADLPEGAIILPIGRIGQMGPRGDYACSPSANAPTQLSSFLLTTHTPSALPIWHPPGRYTRWLTATVIACHVKLAPAQPLDPLLERPFSTHSVCQGPHRHERSETVAKSI